MTSVPARFCSGQRAGDMYRPDIEATNVLAQLDDDQVGMSLWARCYAQERAEPERLRPFG
jgi:hypothetical protein